MREILGQVFSEYKVRGELLWEIYRNGTVHFNQPKTLQNGTKTIMWKLFKGNYGERMIIGQVPTSVGKAVEMPLSHLVPMEIIGLPGRGYCQYARSASTKIYWLRLMFMLTWFRQTQPAEAHFRTTMNVMVQPESTTVQGLQVQTRLSDNPKPHTNADSVYS